MLNIPLFNFPTKVVCVDDDTTVLNDLRNMLSDKFSVSTISNSLEAFKFFKSYKSPLDKVAFLDPLIESELSDSIYRVLVNFDIKNIVNLLHLEDRYQEIAVLIIDYNMPSMNGLELCERLSHLPCKKILLTGDIELPAVVEAFNVKLVDYFIRKSDINLVQEINNHVEILQRKYFLDKTLNLSRTLEAKHLLPFSDKIFIKFFDDFLITYNIKEYYLLDKHGSLLLVDYDGIESFLIINTKRSLLEFINVYEDEPGLEPFISEIKSGGKVPFWGIGVESHQLKSPIVWENYLHVPQKLNGREAYYWIHITSK